jgi:hypothetical protein
MLIIYYLYFQTMAESPEKLAEEAAVQAAVDEKQHPVADIEPVE